MEYMNIEKFREIYVEWQESGQSIRTYAAAIGMKEATFYYWQSKLKSGTSVQLAKNGGFVQMKPSGSRERTQCQTPALCELIYPNGVMLRITSDLSIDELRSLITLSK